MNIEKVKNYNQKLLAVLVTTVTLLAIIGLFTLSYSFITDIVRSNHQDQGILSDEQIEELQEENKRQQLISYDFPKLVDSTNLIYIIPVSHKTLDRAENIDDGTLALINTFDSKNKEINKRYSNQYYGNFNNLLVYDYKNESIQTLFSDRVNFENIRIEYFKDDILILCEASVKDTYKDGVVNLKDYKSLFIFSLKEKDLKEIAMNNADVNKVDFIEESKDMIIQFGKDHNNNGKFDEYIEPSVIKLYVYKTGKLTDIISEEVDKDLQMKLEGTIK